MAQGEACGEVDVGDGWTDIESSEKKVEAGQEIDLDDMMVANVVEEKPVEDDDEDMEPIDIDAENEAMD